MEKNSFFWISTILAIGLVFFAWQGTSSTNNIDQITFAQNPNTISSVGEAQTEVAPDEAVLNIGHTITMTTADAAQEENTNVMNNVISALKKLGYNDEDMETVTYDVSPNRVWRSSKYVTEGYKATYRIRLTTDKIDEVGKVIDAAINAGANDIDSINFGLKDETEKQVREELFAQAAENARDKADNVAKGLGVSVKGVRSASIDNFYYPRYYGEYAMAEGALAIDSAPTQIQYGDLEVSVSVSVSFLI